MIRNKVKSSPSSVPESVSDRWLRIPSRYRKYYYKKTFKLNQILFFSMPLFLSVSIHNFIVMKFDCDWIVWRTFTKTMINFSGNKRHSKRFNNKFHSLFVKVGGQIMIARVTKFWQIIWYYFHRIHHFKWHRKDILGFIPIFIASLRASIVNEWPTLARICSTVQEKIRQGHKQSWRHLLEIKIDEVSFSNTLKETNNKPFEDKNDVCNFWNCTIKSNLSYRPAPNNDHLSTATTIVWSHFQLL